MGKYVDREFVASLVHFYYNARKSHFSNCKCARCKRLQNLLDQMEKWSFYTSNVYHNKWFFIYNLTDSSVTLFPVFI